jgi:LmbE family N-acetylglucosaminyl deacetylase
MTEHVFQPLQPRVVLCVVAHPDDIEFVMGGTVAKYVAEGAVAYYYVLTNANKGSSDRSVQPNALRDIRCQEQRDAAKILGVQEVFFSDYEDGGLEVTQAVKRDVVRVVRRVKPDVVLTFDPSMLYASGAGIINHPDHRAAGQATLDAVYPLARDHLSFPELAQKEGLEPHVVSTVLLNNLEKQNFFVDITAYMEQKLAALAAHASQIPDKDKTFGYVRQQAEITGRHVGARYAESFVRIDVST